MTLESLYPLYTHDKFDPQAQILPQQIAEIGVTIRAWTELDFAAIQRLSSAEGWPTPERRPADALNAWRHFWPALVAMCDGEVVGFLRALTDSSVTLYIAEVLVVPEWRGQEIATALIEVCHRLCPSARLDVLSTETAEGFCEAQGFRRFPGFRKSYC